MTTIIYLVFILMESEAGFTLGRFLQLLGPNIGMVTTSCDIKSTFLTCQYYRIKISLLRSVKKVTHIHTYRLFDTLFFED